MRADATRPTRTAPIAIDVRSPTGTLIAIRLFPPVPELAADVRRAWSIVARSGGSDDLAPALQEHLRTWYPRLIVRPRVDVASFSAGDELWYVFRDGGVRRRAQAVERMYTALFRARQVSADTEVAMGRAAEAMRSAGEPRRRQRRVSSSSGGR